MNLRSGRLKGKMTNDAALFTSSLEFDRRIFEADIRCNLAHTTMLKEQGIINREDADRIIEALTDLKIKGIDAIKMDPSVEDVHIAIENYVTDQIGEIAGFMHTAKSRNDQVATDLRLVLKDEINNIQTHIINLISIIVDKANKHKETVMVGYTHLQHAQPTTFAHHLLSYAYAIKRDYSRLQDAYKRVDMNPLGAAALTTTSFAINRERTTELLGFGRLLENSIDAVSSRDFIAETVFALSMLSSNLSKICEEMIIWSTYEFRMVEISDEYSSTSSIMPQKKNPDVAEIARAKTANIYGELITILTILKALPQSYNRDLQEITPHLWNVLDTSHSLLEMISNMISTVEFKVERGVELANANFSTATELADLIVKERKIPFRVAHQIVGRTITEALDTGINPIEIDSIFLDKISEELIGQPLHVENELIEEALDPYKVIRTRKIVGGPSPEMVSEAILKLRDFIDKNSK